MELIQISQARDLRWLIMRSRSRENLMSLGRVVAGGQQSSRFDKRIHSRIPADNDMKDDDVPQDILSTPLRQANVGHADNDMKDDDVPQDILSTPLLQANVGQA